MYPANSNPLNRFSLTPQSDNTKIKRTRPPIGIAVTKTGDTLLDDQWATSYPSKVIAVQQNKTNARESVVQVI